MKCFTIQRFLDRDLLSCSTTQHCLVRVPSKCSTTQPQRHLGRPLMQRASNHDMRATKWPSSLRSPLHQRGRTMHFPEPEPVVRPQATHLRDLKAGSTRTPCLPNASLRNAPRGSRRMASSHRCLESRHTDADRQVAARRETLMGRVNLFLGDQRCGQCKKRCVYLCPDA